MGNSSTYKIIHDSIKDKEEAIFKIEGLCPSCGRSNGIRYTEERPGKNRIRYKYDCPSCGSVWRGNTYTDNLEKAGTASLIKNCIPHIIGSVIAVLTLCFAIQSPLLYLGVFFMDISLFGIWLIARLIEINATGKETISANIKNAALISFLTVITYSAIKIAYVFVVYGFIPIFTMY